MSKQPIAIDPANVTDPEPEDYTVFYNVTVSIAKPPKEAYALLCELLGAAESHHRTAIDWWTSTYARGESEDQRNTDELWPESGS